MLPPETVTLYSNGHADRNHYIYMLTVEDLAQVYRMRVSGDSELTYDLPSPFWDLPIQRQEALIKGAMRAVEHYFGEHWVETIEIGFDSADA